MDGIRTDANGRKYIYNEENPTRANELESLRAQVETLQWEKAETIRSCDAICDSYAAENQQFADELSAAKEQNALLTQAADSVAVQEPEGWKLVPIEPTKKMIEAARTHYESQAYTGEVSTYKAMLATAPTLDKE